MSRTFEALDRAQQGQELFRVAPVIKAYPATGSATGCKIPPTDREAFTRAEVLRLIQRLFFAIETRERKGPRRVVFCDVDQSTGSKLLCADVGRSLAMQVQSQVCLVDANVGAAYFSLFDLLPCQNPPKSEEKATQRILQRVADNLCVISPLPGLGDERPTLDQRRALVRSLGDEFAYVVISAPPMGLYGDAEMLAQGTDGVVLVLEANSTRRAAAQRAKLLLEAANITVLGTVLNNRTFPIPEGLYRRL